MSANNISEQDTNAMMLSCASCGTVEVDDIKLKTCTACKSVRYCSVTCQRNHRPKYKRACKKRAAELHDELLFQQTEGTHRGDCPICLLPLPIDREKSVYFPCCSKWVCAGCAKGHLYRQTEQRLQQTCPFCRYAIGTSDPHQMTMKRIQANDPAALSVECENSCREGKMWKHLNMRQRRRHWVMRSRIINYQCCIGRGKVLRRTRKRSIPFGKGCYCRSSRSST